MTIDYTVEFNEDDMRRYLELVQKVYGRALELFAIEMWRNTMVEAPVQHGRLQGSFDLNQLDEMSWRISSDVEYALFVYQGTGVFGPTGQPIRPVNASVLAFEWKGQTWFLREVQGQRPNPYIDRAMDSTEARAAEFAQTAIDEMAGAA